MKSNSAFEELSAQADRALQLSAIGKALDEAEKSDPLEAIEVADSGCEFSNLPWPGGALGRVAYWIYTDVMVDPQKDMAILAAYLLAAAFSGRKDSLKRNPPVIQCRVLALNGTGKDAIRQALEMIIEAIAYGENAIAGALVFSGVSQTFGTKRMILDDLATLSNVRIISEAGIAKRSNAGDKENVRAAMMQNFGQDAYSRRTYPGFAQALPPTFGVNTSVYEESTKETFLATMQGQLATGEAARMMSVRIDASNVGDAKLQDHKPVPDSIVGIFRTLANEALRGESKDPETGYYSGKPVPQDLRRVFQLSDDAQGILDRLLAERTAFKRSNVSNVASLEWAQRVRYEQLVLRVALVIARTENLFDQHDPKSVCVTGEQLQQAIAFVDECRRTERANGGDYEDPLTRLIEAMYKFACDQFKNPNATYLRKHPSEQDRKDRKINTAVFTGGNCAPRSLAKDIANSEDNRHGDTIPRVMAKAYETGAELGYWHTSRKGKTTMLKLAARME
ncbi:hypothetical protein [Aliiruegeria lutimaris]|uniref:DUF3987 domain-containing protein n=1 Tax=Aliiruegeria lutimaris TaxID=571298 RepID=A0A1G8UXN9_9RHOB|nr:hypothetical protein [Aliiruegeria lutimaris]SDJ58404.1 hypothetical protein SAMN04488026_102015 [Aliiruegeria lutimaris]